jgi:ABC-type multidrug transport system ATPase subunit
MPLLVADSVAKSFGSRRVLSSASLRAEHGQIRALLGRNGIGKSTLIKIACGLSEPDGGMLAWRDQRAERHHYHLLARDGLLLLPADRLLTPYGTVRRQLTLNAKTFPGGASVDAVLERLRLTAQADALAKELSGGEARRADVAAALVRAPECLIADEVFRDLSPLDAELVGSTLREMAAAGTAIVITGHELPFVLGFADHITWCTDGTTYEIGTPAEAERDERLQRGLFGRY